MDQKVCLNMVKKDRSIVCDCTHDREDKIKFDDFTQNGFYGRQPQPFEVVCYNIDANTSCSFNFIKQDLTDKQAYWVSFCFDSQVLFSVLLQTLFGDNLILYHIQGTNYLISRERR